MDKAGGVEADMEAIRMGSGEVEAEDTSAAMVEDGELPVSVFQKSRKLFLVIPYTFLPFGCTL